MSRFSHLKTRRQNKVDFGVRPPIRDNFGSRRPFSFVLGSFESAINVLSNQHNFGSAERSCKYIPNYIYETKLGENFGVLFGACVGSWPARAKVAVVPGQTVVCLSVQP